MKSIYTVIFTAKGLWLIIFTAKSLCLIIFTANGLLLIIFIAKGHWLIIFTAKGFRFEVSSYCNFQRVLSPKHLEYKREVCYKIFPPHLAKGTAAYLLNISFSLD